VVDETPLVVYQERILQLLAARSPLAFADVFAPPRSRARLVGLFLALLELIKGRQLVAEQKEAFGEIWLKLAA
jgi:chromatin segregation and condensation protein Rec8/ScpA/Scc1 (kleisin family)